LQVEIILELSNQELFLFQTSFTNLNIIRVLGKEFSTFSKSKRSGFLTLKRAVSFYGYRFFSALVLAAILHCWWSRKF